jgi:hypothetical protein
LRSFFGILFHGNLSAELMADLGLSRRAMTTPAAAPPPAAARPSDGAVQILAILQRDSRLIDFVMEDIAPYSDEQVGVAVRSLHDQARDCLARYVSLQPVIDGVEGTFTRPPTSDPATVKFIGNVPAGTPSGGVLRHRGWRAGKVDLPPIAPRQDTSIVAPAEIEIE